MIAGTNLTSSGGASLSACAPTPTQAFSATYGAASWQLESSVAFSGSVDANPTGSTAFYGIVAGAVGSFFPQACDEGQRQNPLIPQCSSCNLGVTINYYSANIRCDQCGLGFIPIPYVRVEPPLVLGAQRDLNSSCSVLRCLHPAAAVRPNACRVPR